MSFTTFAVITVIAFFGFTSARPGGFGHRDNCNVTCTKGHAARVCSAVNATSTCNTVPAQPICVIVRGERTTALPVGRRNFGFGGRYGGWGHHFGDRVPPLTLNSVCDFCASYSNQSAEIISCCACRERNSTSTTASING